MKVCRTCLSRETRKDINELHIDNAENGKNYAEIIQFCLNIQITQDSTISTKLCSMCYKKILSFHDFKCVALKSDAYLKSVLVSDTDDKTEIFIRDNVKTESLSADSNGFSDAFDTAEIKYEDLLKSSLSGGNPHIVGEDKECQSDDELLSVIKQIKYEQIVENPKENVPFKRKKEKIKKPKIEENQVCEECGKTVRNLKEHLNLHQPLSMRRRFKCKMCDKVFSSHSARYKHHKIKHLGIKQKCSICNKYVVNVKQHELVVHNTAALPHECVSCGRRFISQSALDTHVVVHTKDRPHQCTLCEKKFRTKIVMMQHRRQVHEKEKSHLCQFCSKSFFKKYHLQVHLRSHTKEKPYECPDCGKFFSSTTILKNHRLTHSDVKMFSCAHCDMTFNKPGYLRVHMISHTKEKRYACKYCGVKFGRSDHRKRHENSVHERHLAGRLSDLVERQRYSSYRTASVQPGMKVVHAWNQSNMVVEPGQRI